MIAQKKAFLRQRILEPSNAMKALLASVLVYINKHTTG